MGFGDLGTHHLTQAVKGSGTILVDTSSLSQDGDTTITLTYTLNAVKRWEPLDVQVAFSADNWFTLSQNTTLPYTQFRPRDARVGAIAQCDAHPDGRYPKFKLYWKCAGLVFQQQPGLSAATAQGGLHPGTRQVPQRLVASGVVHQLRPYCGHEYLPGLHFRTGSEPRITTAKIGREDLVC